MHHHLRHPRSPGGSSSPVVGGVARRFLWVLAALAASGRALPDGAPERVCQSMLPHHPGVEPQTSPPKYVVKTERLDGGHVRVRIHSEEGEEEALRGFALQARAASDPGTAAEGYFYPADEATRTVDCFDGIENMLTHVEPLPKREVCTVWVATGAAQVVFFRATVAKTFHLFWTEVDSEPVRVVPGYAPRTTTLSPDAQSKKAEEEQRLARVLDGCSDAYGCFGMPSGCVRRKNCLVLLTYGTVEFGIAFKLYGLLRPRSYMAVGLSADGRMGDDLVTECIQLSAADVTVRESWNSGKSNTENTNGKWTYGTRYHIPKYTDGIVTCYWETRLSFDFNGVHFDLENSTYVLLAEGPMNILRTGMHRHKLASPHAVSFTDFEMFAEGKVPRAVQLHGALMVTAWIGFVSFGIYIARYFKDGWRSRTWWSRKVWFAIHQCCMILSLLCVGISVVVIFVHYKGWNSGNEHSVVGLATVVLAFLQPVIANFRPAPESPRWRVFQWLHRCVGTLAHVLSLVTLFLASMMETSGLDNTFFWVLTIYVAVHLLFHVVLQAHFWKTKARRTNEINMSNMARDRNTDQRVVQNTVSIFHVSFRYMLLSIYTMVLISIVVSLYFLIGKASFDKRRR